MTLIDEYRRQAAWRDWDTAMDLCPLEPGQTVLDLGCGPGEVCGRLAARGLQVTGIDRNPDLIAAARSDHPACHFSIGDLKDINLPPQSFDGLWCSFTLAYLLPFEPWLARWSRLLKPKAWICIIEMDELLSHAPLPGALRDRIEGFYTEAFTSGRYDFRAGRRVQAALGALGFATTATKLADRELSFQGSASPDVFDAWRLRLARMGGLHTYFGPEYGSFESDFLKCLSAHDHSSGCSVICGIGQR